MTTQSTISSKPENPFARQYADFVEFTKDHQLKVIHNDGLYCHLRVQAPGTRMWSWDVNTWPWHLATSGDIADGYMFTRNEDMLLDFFYIEPSHRYYYSDGAPSIDFRYWAEKLTGGRSHEVKKYDSDVFARELNEHLLESETLGEEAQEHHEKMLALLAKIHELRGLDENTRKALLEAHWDTANSKASVLDSARMRPFASAIHQARGNAAIALDALWNTEAIGDDAFNELVEKFDYDEVADSDIPRQSPAERRQELIDDAAYHAESEDQAHQWLSDQEDAIGYSDTWEWSLREYDGHFINTCYAIELTTRLWKQHVETNGVNDTYILLDGGLVHNKPAAPVFNLDVLSSDLEDDATALDALDLRTQIIAHPQARRDLPDVVANATEFIQAAGGVETVAQLNTILAEEQRRRDEQARIETERAQRAAAQQAQQDELNAKHSITNATGVAHDHLIALIHA